MNTRVLIIGAGIAGLSTAYYLAQAGVPSIVISKSDPITTTWAKGGIAVALSDTDSTQLHHHDTIIAGAGRCDPAMVDILVNTGPDRLRDLVHMGVEFDRDTQSLPPESTGYHFGQEAAHQRRRILHVGDQTGKVIHATMYQAVRALAPVTLQTNTMAVSLLKDDHNQCRGAVIYRNGRRECITAEAVVIASGGAAYIYDPTSVPSGCYGDGIALAHHAGARIRDMAFVQFHPTLLYGTQFLISEVVRGEGARLRDWSGNLIMGHHASGDLAPRDQVSRCIIAAMQADKQPHAWLDMRDCTVSIRDRFPALYTWCRTHGYDPHNQLPVVPAAHYTMGGVQTDSNGQTTLPRLYAVGEVASTRVHGANRLASNSLLEGLVFGYRVAQHFNALPHLSPVTLPTNWPDQLPMTPGSTGRIHQLRQLMSHSAGIIRTQAQLHAASAFLDEHCPIKQPCTYDQWQYNTMHTVATEIIRDSLAQTENCGSFFCQDLAICTQSGCSFP